MLNTYEASNAILRQIHTSVYLKTLQNEVLKIDVEQKKNHHMYGLVNLFHRKAKQVFCLLSSPSLFSGTILGVQIIYWKMDWYKE